MRLLSPQHFAANCENNDVTTDNTQATQFWNQNILTWGKQGEYKKYIYNSRMSNIMTFYTLPSTNDFLSFATKVKEKEDEHMVFASEEIEEELPPLAEENNDAVKQNDENIFSSLPN